MNIGNEDRNDLKFIFNDPKAGTANIYAEEGTVFQDEDVVYPYGEVSYHSDGSLMHKFPNYPDSSKEYINPQGEGFRRRELSEIEEWEPLFEYEIFDYNLLRKQKKVSSEEKYVITSENNFFNGSSLECMLILANKSFDFAPSEDKLELIDRVEGITEDLDLIITFVKIKKQGHWVKFKGSDERRFSNLNVIHVLKRRNT